MCGHSSCAKPACTWSAQHKHECEARFVMAMPRIDRMEYYSAIKKKRGDAAAQALVSQVKRQWEQ